jgi:hypothetical protein
LRGLPWVLSALLALCASTLWAAAPVVDDFSASPASVAPGGVVTLTVQAHDPDCPDVCPSGCGQYIRADLTGWIVTGGTILSEDNGVSGSPYTATAQWQAPDVEDVYTITVSLSDSGSFVCGGRQTTTANLDVIVTTSTNQPPVVDALTADPVLILPGQTSDLSCAASDPDGDTVSYSWATDLGVVTPGAGGLATFTAAAPGVATITCTATDPGSLFGSDSVQVSIIGAIADTAITSGLTSPRRLSVDSDGNVYVVDRAAGGINVVNLFSGQFLYRLTVSDANAVAIDWNNDLLVGGATGPRLIDRTGQDVPGVLLGNNLGPVSDVEVDLVNRRYGVLHDPLGRVVVYDETGAQIAAFGSTGDGPDQLRGPQGLAVTPSGNWVVGDTGHGLVKTFDLTGTVLSSFGGLGGEVGEFVRLDDVAVDSAGAIYASDSFQDWVLAFNPDGSLRETLGTYGAGVGQFQTAAGIVSADDFDRLLVASVDSSSVQVFRTSDAPVVPPGAAVPDLSPPGLVFAEQPAGSVSQPQTLTLTNTGASVLGLHEITLQGDFAQSNDCGPFLDSGQNCTLDVSFRPDAIGDLTGNLVVDTTGTPARQAASLAGTAFMPLPEVAVSPSLLVFGDQTVGTVSAPLAVTLSNVGLAPLTIAAIDISAEYTETHDCLSSLAAGSSCTILVSFAPVTVSDHVLGTLTISTDAANSPHTVDLDGPGTPVVPLIAIDDVSLDEGNDGDFPEATFTVTLSETTTETVTVGYEASSDTAVEREDFQAASGALIFHPGETSHTVTVRVIGDEILEPDEEVFWLTLIDPIGAVFENSLGTGTIRDDEECVGPNLVVNPGAEDRLENGSIPGWTQTAGEWQRREAPPTPVEGDHLFYAGAVAYAELVQEIDVSAFSQTIDADTQWFTFEAWVRNLYEAPTDTLRLIVEYRDETNTFVLDQFDTEPFASPAVWTRVINDRLAPIGTRFVRIYLIARNPGVAYFDAVALRSLRAATVVVDDVRHVEGDAGFGDAVFPVRLACPFHEEVNLDYWTTACRSWGI